MPRRWAIWRVRSADVVLPCCLGRSYEHGARVETPNVRIDDFFGPEDGVEVLKPALDIGLGEMIVPEHDLELIGHVGITGRQSSLAAIVVLDSGADLEAISKSIVRSTVEG